MTPSKYLQLLQRKGAAEYTYVCMCCPPGPERRVRQDDFGWDDTRAGFEVSGLSEASAQSYCLRDLNERLLQRKERSMGIISWVVLGLVVGALAKLIMPGKDPGGIIITILIGVVGALLGGFVGSMLGLGAVTGFDLRSLGLAVGGALILLWGYRRFKRA